MEIFYLPKFAREYKKLSKEVKDEAEKKEIIFRRNPFDPQLKTHKLHGELSDFWAFSVTYKCRIIFDFLDAEDEKSARFYSIGDHDVY